MGGAGDAIPHVFLFNYKYDIYIYIYMIFEWVIFHAPWTASARSTVRVVACEVSEKGGGLYGMRRRVGRRMNFCYYHYF